MISVQNNADVQLVVRIHCNTGAVPAFVPVRTPVIVKNKIGGEQLTKKPVAVSIKSLIDDLLNNRLYVMVDCYVVHKQGGQSIIQFVFFRTQDAIRAEGFDAIEQDAIGLLSNLSGRTYGMVLWRNWLFKDQKPVRRKFSLSLNFAPKKVHDPKYVRLNSKGFIFIRQTY